MGKVVKKLRGVILLMLALFAASAIGAAGSSTAKAADNAEAATPAALNVVSVEKPALESGYVNIKIHFDGKFLGADDIPVADNDEKYNVLEKIELNGMTLSEIEAAEGSHKDWVIVDFIKDEPGDMIVLKLNVTLPAAVNLKKSPGYGTVFDSTANAVGGMSYGGNEIRLDKDLIFPDVNGEFSLRNTTWLSFFIDAWHIDTESADFSAAMTPSVEAAGVLSENDRYSFFKLKFKENLYPVIVNNITAGNDWINQNHNPHMISNPPMTDDEKNAYMLSGIRRSFYDHLKVDIADGKGYVSAGELITSVTEPSLLNDAVYIILAADGADTMRVRFDKNALSQFTGTDMYISFKLEAGLRFPGFDGETHLERFTNGRTLKEDVIVTFNLDTGALETALAAAESKAETDYSSSSWAALETALGEARAALASANKGNATTEQIAAAAAKLNDAVAGLKETSPASASIVGEIPALKVGKDPDLSTLKIRVAYDNNSAKNYSVKQEWLSSSQTGIVTPAYDNTKLGEQTVYVIYTEKSTTVAASFKLTFINDREALSAAITEAEKLVEIDYSLTSWEALESALNAAKAVNLETASQSDIDGAFAALEAAVEALTARTLSSIEIVGTVAPVTVGEEPDLSAVKVKKIYDNGFEESVALTASMLSAFDKTTAGEKTVTVTVDGKTATLKITYNAASGGDDEKGKSGCKSVTDFEGAAIGAFILLAACILILVLRRKREKSDSNK